MNDSIPVPQKPYAAMLLAAIGAASGAGIILYNSRATTASQEFISTPEFWAWLFVMCTQTAFFAVVVVPLLQLVKQLKHYFAGNKIDIVLSTVIASAMFWAPPLVRGVVLSDIDWPLTYHGLKMVIIVGLGFVPILLAAVGIWLVHAALRTTFASSEPDKELVQRYLYLQDNLQWLLWTLGAMISLATLAAGAQRNALIAVAASNANKFSSAMVLTYGAYLTMLLFLIYVPVHKSLLTAGCQLQDAFFPLLSPDSDSWADIHSKREKLGDLLKLQMTAGQSFKTSIAILSPLIGSIVSTLLS